MKVTIHCKTEIQGWIEEAVNRRFRQLSQEIYARPIKPLKDKMCRPEDSVNLLNLSCRAANCLNNANISTIGDLVSKSMRDLFKLRCFGKKTVWEINGRLSAMGYSLRDENE